MFSQRVLEGLRSIRGHVHLEALILEHELDGHANAAVVLRYQYLSSVPISLR